jgi:hypothetical protein
MSFVQGFNAPANGILNLFLQPATEAKFLIEVTLLKHYANPAGGGEMISPQNAVRSGWCV